MAEFNQHPTEADVLVERNHLRERLRQEVKRADEAEYRGWQAGEKNAALKTRVAELEADNVILQQQNAQFGEQLQRVRDALEMANRATQLSIEETRRLQSQLAWTPVSDGLPTEPGYYLFVGGVDEPLIFELSELGRVDDMPLDWTHTQFRRIELPEAK